MMTNKAFEKYTIDPSSHLCNTRRVLTKQEHNQSQYLNQQKQSIESPYFKVQNRTQFEKINQKNKFLSTLITKIKSVERTSNNSSLSKHNSKNQPTQINFQASRYKIGGYCYSKYDRKQQGSRFCTEYRNHQETKPSYESQELQQQNFILRTKMTQLIIENQKLKIQIAQLKKKAEQNTQKQMIKQHEKTSNQNESLLLSFQSMDLINQQQIRKSKSIQLSFSNIKFQRDHKLSIITVFDKIIFPSENQELVKASKQIKQLKHQNSQIQKKWVNALNQYRKKKEKQIEDLKKGFSNNLNHYKQLLHKLSAKPSAAQTNKLQEDTLQTAIFQSILFDQE